MLAKEELIKLLKMKNCGQKFQAMTDVWNKAVGDQYEVHQNGDIVLISEDSWNKLELYSKNKLRQPFCRYSFGVELTTLERRSAEIARREALQREQEQAQQLLDRQNEYCDQMGYPKHNEYANGQIVYCTIQPALRYYWSLIGDKYILLKNGNILLDPQVYNQIMQHDKFMDLSGRAFLNRLYRPFGWKRKCSISGVMYERKEPEDENISDEIKGYGVYALCNYDTHEIEYIGMTMRSFYSRLQEHSNIMNGIEPAPEHMPLYQAGLKPNHFYYKILFDARDALVEGGLTKRDVEAIELAFITIHRPKYNYQGLKGIYKFT